jgi:hypothetical protein
MDNEVYSSNVDEILAAQRDESDARSIINEVERINSLEGIHQFRWIWELMQNAKDEAGDGIDVTVKLSEGEFFFEHNGKSFQSAQLLALLRKTSTKPINGSEGNTGKFGTGFVTSHLLNKVVQIEGVHENALGKRRFTFELNRTAENLDSMKSSISSGIQKIRDIDSIAPESIVNPVNRFRYLLGKNGYRIAIGGIDQLKLNLPFAMLVNDKFKSIKIEQQGTSKYFSKSVKSTTEPDVHFAYMTDEELGQNIDGLLFYYPGNLKIAVPATFRDGHYSLVPLDGITRLFKDLPLIGTEDFYIPVILQHELFQPTEPRDGIRMTIASDTEEIDDKIAVANRNALKEFVHIFPNFLERLTRLKVQNLHLLAESGLPLNADNYYDLSWYQEHIQKHLRNAVLSHKLVQTVSGKMIPISEAKFASCGVEHLDAMFKLLTKWYPDNCPDEKSYTDWWKIISQETVNWPSGIMITIEDLVKVVAEKERVDNFELIESERISWLQDLVSFLELSGNERLGHDYAIYPCQDGSLALQNKVFHDIGIEDRFKSISEGMGRKLQKELLPLNFKATYIEPFEEKKFLETLNIAIGALNVESASTEQIQAVFNVCSTFKPTKAEKRDQWYKLLFELLPEKIGNRVETNLKEEYQWDPAEKCALKYVSYLVQSSETLEAFSKLYFQGNDPVALDWLNGFYDFVFRNEENKASALLYKIVLTQDDLFRQYSENIYQEEYPFDERIKELYKDYITPDPKCFLVHEKIVNEKLKATSQLRISGPIDDLFRSRDSEELVIEGQKYHSLFLRLKEWTDDHPNIANRYFSMFMEKKPILYIKAFGGDKFGRLLKINKTVEELEQFADLKLSASDMKKLDEAVSKLGGSNQLLDKAQEMIEYADLIRWRKEVGDAAEQAFKEAIGEADSKYLDPENPDVGRDFVIRIGEKEFSIEIKSAVEGKETVKMSILQGEEAVKHKDHYALCVISRPGGQLTTKDDFINRARFVPNIGDHIGDKISNWRSGLNKLDSFGEVSVELDSKSGAVNIRKGIWKDGLNFEDFVRHLRSYFDGNQQQSENL